jgi:hypothetical protein
MPTKTPRTQTGLIPTTHKNEMNRLASPEAVISLPPKPPPIHYRFKGEKKQSSMTPPLTRTRRKSTNIPKEWDSSFVEKSMYAQTAVEMRNKENCKNAVSHFLQSSAKKRQQLDALEKRLNDEIESERISMEDIVEHDSNNYEMENGNSFNQSMENQFSRLKTSFLSLLNECHEEPLANEMDTMDSAIESRRILQNKCIHKVPSNATIQPTKPKSSSNEESFLDSSWKILHPEQRLRIQKRMKEIYMNKYSHNSKSQCVRDVFSTDLELYTDEIASLEKVRPLVATRGNKKHDEGPDVSPLKDNDNHTDDCVSSLIASISEQFQMDLIEHVTVLNNDFAQNGLTHEINSPESQLKEQPKHPYSLPLAEEYKQSILQESNSN